MRQGIEYGSVMAFPSGAIAGTPKRDRSKYQHSIIRKIEPPVNGHLLNRRITQPT